MSEQLELEIAWATVAAVGTDADRAGVVGDDVIARHRQAHRRYHGVHHVRWVLRHAAAIVADDRAPAGVDHPAVLAAAFFHDAVYDPHAGDNEQRSAELAGHQLRSCGWPEERVTTVVQAIVASAGHAATMAPDAPVDATTAVLLDADLAVLGAEPAGYAAYVTGVRAEYGFLDDTTWRAGRAAVLGALLARRSLFHTVPAQDWWEATARANVSGELAALGAR